MSIVTSHREFILERILLGYLLKGEIPTADQLEEDLAAYEAIHPSMAEPTSKQVDFDIEHGGESSASKIQEIVQYISDDVSIITREMKHIVEKGKAHYERWTFELLRLLNKAKRIENEIDILLLMQGETAGYFSHVTDVLVDMNNLDMDLTTAKIDTQETSATLNPDPSFSGDASGGTRLNFSHLVESDISFSVLSTAPTGYSPSPNTKLVDAFLSPGQAGIGWVGTVAKSKQGETIAEVKIHLHHTVTQKVSRVVFDLNVAAAGGDGTVACMHSIDGYQWYMVDHPTPVQAIEAGNISWHFPMTDMSWLKFIITKNNYDESSGGTYYYKFGVSSIRLYGHNYTTDYGNELVTKALQPLNAEGQAVPFSIVGLDACEENTVLDGEKLTDIEYFLSVSADGNEWTDEVQVEPSSRENPSWPSMVNFGGMSRQDNIKDTGYSKIDTSLPSRALVSNFGGFVPYALKPGFAVVNTAIPLYEDTTMLCYGHIADSMQVWRNVFNSSRCTALVNDVSIGWGKQDTEYSCSFYISSTKGVSFDFGEYECIIDGVPRSGEVSLYRGVHTISTSHWYNFYEEGYSSPQTIDELMGLDPLYPYNHKIIIEGFVYPATFIGEQKYSTGADIVAQYFCKRTSVFNLESNLSSEERPKYFAFIKSIGLDDAPMAAILLSRDMSTPDYNNEYCRLLWSSGGGGFKYVKLRAEFSTEDVAYTPVLYSYRLKIGA